MLSHYISEFFVCFFKVSALEFCGKYSIVYIWKSTLQSCSYSCPSGCRHMYWWGRHFPPLKTVRQRRKARPGKHAVLAHGKFVSAALGTRIRFPPVPSFYKCSSACKHAADTCSPPWWYQGLFDNKRCPNSCWLILSLVSGHSCHSQSLSGLPSERFLNIGLVSRIARGGNRVSRFWMWT